MATAGNPNPMQRVDAYMDSGGETHAANNLTTSTANGPPIVNNFQTTAANNGPNAFTYNNDLTAGSFSITNTPVCTPAPSVLDHPVRRRVQGGPVAAEARLLGDDPGRLRLRQDGSRDARHRGP